MSTVRGPGPRPAAIVVGIGDRGLESYHAAVRLGAEEAVLRRLPLRLVHGSRPPGEQGESSVAEMAARQQRGRRLVGGAARDLAGTPLGREIRISAESSPQTGVELLLAHAPTAVMLVLQRRDGRDRPTGSTVTAVAAAVGCTMLVTRSAMRSVGEVGVLVVLGPEHDPAPAMALAFDEAALRRVAVSVLDGRGDGGAAQLGIRLGRAAHPYVTVRQVEVEAGRTAERFREIGGEATLLVVVRPAPGRVTGTVAAAVDGVTCPVLLVVPVATPT